MDGKLTFTVQEVARLLGLSKNGTYLAIAEGAIPHIRVRGRILIPRQKLLDWLNAGGKVAA